MKREEIEAKIKEVLMQVHDGNFYLDVAETQLTDLFIELSNERCKEQREICVDAGCLDNGENICHNIRTTTLPEIV